MHGILDFFAWDTMRDDNSEVFKLEVSGVNPIKLFSWIYNRSYEIPKILFNKKSAKFPFKIIFWKIISK